MRGNETDRERVFFGFFLAVVFHSLNWFLRLLHDGWFFLHSAVRLVWINVIKLIKLTAECGFAFCVYAANLVRSYFSFQEEGMLLLGLERYFSMIYKRENYFNYCVFFFYLFLNGEQEFSSPTTLTSNKFSSRFLKPRKKLTRNEAVFLQLSSRGFTQMTKLRVPFTRSLSLSLTHRQFHRLLSHNCCSPLSTLTQIALSVPLFFLPSCLYQSTLAQTFFFVLFNCLYFTRILPWPLAVEKHGCQITCCKIS